MAATVLLFKKTRKFAVAAAIAVIVSIELGARELIFGCLFGALLAVFYPRKNGSPSGQCSQASS